MYTLIIHILFVGAIKNALRWLQNCCNSYFVFGQFMESLAKTTQHANQLKGRAITPHAADSRRIGRNQMLNISCNRWRSKFSLNNICGRQRSQLQLNGKAAARSKQRQVLARELEPSLTHKYININIHNIYLYMYIHLGYTCTNVHIFLGFVFRSMLYLCHE